MSRTLLRGSWGELTISVLFLRLDWHGSRMLSAPKQLCSELLKTAAETSGQTYLPAPTREIASAMSSLIS